MPKFSKYDLYRIYAPALWKHAQEEERHGRHPTVMADKDGKGKKHDDPPQMKMEPFNPLQFYCTFGSIYLIFLLKFVEKSLAKLEFLKRAMKKLAAKREAKKSDAECNDESVSVTTELSNNSMM